MATNTLDASDLTVSTHDMGLRICAAQEIDAAFNALDQKKVSAVLVGSDPSYIIQREQIINLTKRYAMPAIIPRTNLVVKSTTTPGCRPTRSHVRETR
jgi:hypothetical protein